MPNFEVGDTVRLRSVHFMYGGWYMKEQLIVIEDGCSSYYNICSQDYELVKKHD
jgi:hypothetical protein